MDSDVRWLADGFRPSLLFRSSVLQKGVVRSDVNQLYRQSSFPRYTPQPGLAALVASWLIFLVARAISRKILTFDLVWCLLSRCFPSGCRHPSIWFLFLFLFCCQHTACASGVLPGFWVSVTPSTWSIPSATYILRRHAVCHSMYSVVGATSVRSLPELPQHGVSRHRAGAPDAGGYSNTESPGVSASVRSLSDTCLLTMFH